jgi:hypothetical protein
MDDIQVFYRFQELPIHLIVPINVISLRKKRFTENASGTNGWSDAVSYASDSTLCDHAAIEE